jgi:putative flippase GtrA
MIVRYFFVGGIAALVDWTLFGVFAQWLRLPWFPVALSSFVVATLVNYLLSVRHVFRSGVRFSTQHEVAMVFVVSAAGLAINQAVLWVLIERAHWNMLLGKVQATGIVFLWNYCVRRFYIFRPTPRSADLDAER